MIITASLPGAGLAASLIMDEASKQPSVSPALTTTHPHQPQPTKRTPTKRQGGKNRSEST